MAPAPGLALFLEEGRKGGRQACRCQEFLAFPEEAVKDLLFHARNVDFDPHDRIEIFHDAVG